MICLTQSALIYATNICEELAGYKVCIVVPSKKMSDNCVDIIRTNMKSDFMKIRNINTEHMISFDNGSYINICIATDCFKGMRTNLLIVDKDIDKELINCVYKPMEINK